MQITKSNFDISSIDRNMKISKKSLHYRFIHYFWTDDTWYQNITIYTYYIMIFITIILFPLYIIYNIGNEIYKWIYKRRPDKVIDFVD